MEDIFWHIELPASDSLLHRHGANTTFIAVCRSYGFETCFGLISLWVLAQRGNLTRHSYCVGVAAGLECLAYEDEDSRKQEHGMQMLVISGERIAEEYLAAKNIKLRRPPAGTSPKDLEAFENGRQDGRRINVRGKRLEE